MTVHGNVAYISLQLFAIYMDGELAHIFSWGHAFYWDKEFIFNGVYSAKG